jgi:hypothetical protein
VIDDDQFRWMVELKQGLCVPLPVGPIDFDTRFNQRSFCSGTRCDYAAEKMKNVRLNGEIVRNVEENRRGFDCETLNVSNNHA